MASLDLAAVNAIGDALFADDAPHGRSLALLVLQSGEVRYERYGVQPDTPFGPGGPVDADTTLISWSMAKSITHAAVGVLVRDGRLDPAAPAAVPEWKGTPKEAITLQHLLNMRSGLHFVEDYVDEGVSNCLEMLFGSGAADAAAYAAALPLDHEPGTVWNYSSGTTNIISRIIGDVVSAEGVSRQSSMEAFLRDRLFGPIGMHSAIPKFDDAGTFIGSSYVFATARDFAKFGEFYRHDGVTADGVRLLPEGWMEHARTWTAHDDEGSFDYGAQWWLWPEFPGSLACHGYEGQHVVVVPDRELVVVHLGKRPAENAPLLEAPLAAIIRAAHG
jgi:CubicO group peptidase (beta-lactamase class C family)